MVPEMIKSLVSAEARKTYRSAVRILVTFGAAIYLFVIGPCLIWKIYNGVGGDTATNVSDAKDLFMTILPVASAVVSFWFAGRATAQKL